MNWYKEVEQRKEKLIEDTVSLLQIKSVFDETTVTKEQPLGSGIADALQYMLELGEKDGFTVKNVDGYAGHIEYGEGEELIGILCHLDVVPEGDGWTTPPFDAQIRDGKIFARGAIDDKGPTMGAYYALKIVKELGLPINKRIRIILGTDEESNWQCVDHYFANEEMPTMGFAPDADFPIINSEKGICDFFFALEGNKETGFVTSFKSGHRPNMVPDKAVAILYSNDSIEDKFTNFLEENKLNGSYSQDGSEITIVVEGVSAHGMEPDKGVNAALYLASFILPYCISERETKYFNFLVNYLWKDSRGKSIGINHSNDTLGDLTINYGIFSYEQGKEGKISFNLRYPNTTPFTDVETKLHKTANELGFTITEWRNMAPHYVDPSHELIQTLSKVYEEQTGEKAELLAIGGGTYGRSLKAGVAFGPLFVGEEELAHQKDEYILIESLLKATAIYAAAIYELAKK